MYASTAVALDLPKNQAVRAVGSEDRLLFNGLNIRTVEDQQEFLELAGVCEVVANKIDDRRANG